MTGRDRVVASSSRVAARAAVRLVHDEILDAMPAPSRIVGRVLGPSRLPDRTLNRVADALHELVDTLVEARLTDHQETRP